ncbi:MAG: chromate transporter [Lachnospiraceae bacterium]|nr:chromate transporter [Lachnospiraceae bacterium]
MIFNLFITFFKIGLFTIGGGYAMISVVKDECVDKKKWINNEEFLDLLAIAESTPGPIAVNMATYVGYLNGNIYGATLATIGVILPSIIVITVISYFLKDFLQIKIISDAFFGVRIAVSINIIMTAFKLLVSEISHSKYKILTFALFLIFATIIVFKDMFGLNISTMTLVFVAIILGVVSSVIKGVRNL